MCSYCKSINSGVIINTSENQSENYSKINDEYKGLIEDQKKLLTDSFRIKIDESNKNNPNNEKDNKKKSEHQELNSKELKEKELKIIIENNEWLKNCQFNYESEFDKDLDFKYDNNSYKAKFGPLGGYNWDNSRCEIDFTEDYIDYKQCIFSPSTDNSKFVLYSRIYVKSLEDSSKHTWM